MYSFVQKDGRLKIAEICLKGVYYFMKHCIHCGAPINGSAVAFCPKCRKPLKKTSKKSNLIPGKGKKQQKPNGKPKPKRKQPSPKKTIPKHTASPPGFQTPKKKILKNKLLWFLAKLKPKKKKQPEVEIVPVINPMDINYDGYYDDKPTDDGNRQDKDRESLEPELIKRIVIISGGAVIIIIFAIILMFLL
jgi:uncharacterized Zn finger protein (UPF0148 family)